MFYGGFGTSYKEAKPILPKALLLSTAGILITAGLTGLFCYYVVGMSLQEGLLVGPVKKTESERRHRFPSGSGKRKQ